MADIIVNREYKIIWGVPLPPRIKANDGVDGNHHMNIQSFKMIEFSHAFGAGTSVEADHDTKEPVAVLIPQRLPATSHSISCAT